MENKFANNLKELRLAKGLKQSDMAKLLGVAKSTYSMYESGLRTPTIPKAKEIAKILDVSVDYLLGTNMVGFDIKNIKKSIDPLLEPATDELKLMINFNSLNSLGKKEAVKRVEELAEIPKYVTYKKEELNAAHALDNSTDKEKAKDDLIIDKDDEWTL
jgi:transcriptional regulator with XRE-family HTH domain